jgi:hypothetical protein
VVDAIAAGALPALRIPEIRKKNEMQEHDKDKKDSEKLAGESYESPKLVRVSLRPEEAVLGHCKVTGSAGAVAATCRAITCRTVGS